MIFLDNDKQEQTLAITIPVLARNLKDGRQWSRVSIKNMTHLQNFSYFWSYLVFRAWLLRKLQEASKMKITISATFWLIRMMSMSSRRMKLLRVSCKKIASDTSHTYFRRFITPFAHLNIRYGSVLVHHHEIGPPRINSYNPLANKSFRLIFFDMLWCLTCFCQAPQCPQEGTQHKCPK